MFSVQEEVTVISQQTGKPNIQMQFIAWYQFIQTEESRESNRINQLWI